jgi:hypothetical protein
VKTRAAADVGTTPSLRAVLGALSLGVAACAHAASVRYLGEPCTQGTPSRCDGNDRIACEKVGGGNGFAPSFGSPGDDELVVRACGDATCRVRNGRAVCALEPAPNPICLAKGQEGPVDVCESPRSHVRCEAGFVVEREECVWCGDEGSNPYAYRCDGGISAPCRVDAHCARGFRCRSSQCTPDS